MCTYQGNNAMTKRDYYEVLGIEKSAGPDQIKKAYRQKAKKFHPDVYQGDKKEAEEKFKEVSEAYEVLVDENKKAAYDRYGHAGVDQEFGPGGFNWQNFHHYEDISDIFGEILRGFGGGGGGFGGSIFDEIFGGRSARSRGPSQGRSIRYDISITYEEAAKGVEKEISLSRNQKCESCSGTGSAEGSSTRQCSTCGGRGQVQQVQSTGFARMVRVMDCPDCRGRGTIIENPCPSCRGSGLQKKKNSLKVSIPAGIRDGSNLRLRGEGEAGERNTPPGDLNVIIHLRPHNKFVRHGNDVVHETEIDFIQAILGDEIKVPTLTGKAELIIPPGTQPNSVFRLRGQGFPDLYSGRKGDELVSVRVMIPKKLNQDQRELLQQYAEMEGRKLKGKHGSSPRILKKAKKILEGER